MREELIAFVKAAITFGHQHRSEFTLGSLFGTSADGTVPSVRFGYGYHDSDKVVYTLNNVAEIMTVEEAADKFIAFYSSAK